MAHADIGLRVYLLGQYLQTLIKLQLHLVHLYSCRSRFNNPQINKIPDEIMSNAGLVCDECLGIITQVKKKKKNMESVREMENSREWGRKKNPLCDSTCQVLTSAC